MRTGAATSSAKDSCLTAWRRRRSLAVGGQRRLAHEPPAAVLGQQVDARLGQTRQRPVLARLGEHRVARHRRRPGWPARRTRSCRPRWRRPRPRRCPRRRGRRPGATPSRSAASRKMSGAGLPRSTSSPVTTTSNTLVQPSRSSITSMPSREPELASASGRWGRGREQLGRLEHRELGRRPARRGAAPSCGGATPRGSAGTPTAGQQPRARTSRAVPPISAAKNVVPVELDAGALAKARR